jgi:hypothetical protein
MLSIPDLMDEYGLTETEARFARERAAGSSQKDAYQTARPSVSPSSANSTGHNLDHRPRVRAACRSLLAEHDRERSQALVMTRVKAVEDLELVKLRALDDLDQSPPGRKSAGVYTALVSATMGQAQLAGLLVERHRHEHVHAVLPTQVLIERLRRSDPTLAEALGVHLSASTSTEKDGDRPESPTNGRNGQGIGRE